MSQVRQLTWEGRRAGEGYFGQDGNFLVFQSEREPDNPFFQIYLLDMQLGDIQRISPGVGKTTCGWIDPDGKSILFASTHDDPGAKAKQKSEFELRAQGKERRYSWDYDDQYELYRWDRSSNATTRLTQALGYDAEASISPTGEWIAFASNRHAYADKLSVPEQKQLETDPSLFVELYRMRGDGSEVTRLTHVKGYDGGPFFNPDGSRICFRRFSENGATAEIFTMDVEGPDEQQLTRLGAMSWAPFYHPSGKYLIFTTNLHGFGNFELYLVDTQGKSTPQRVTHTEGFDGLASFSPDGKQLTWTSNRTASKQSQIFLANWDHEQALALLGLTGETAERSDEQAADPQAAAGEALAASAEQIREVDLIRHVDYLCRPELEGRLTGTPGEALATGYVAAYLDSLGLEPAGDHGTFLQAFEFTAGVALGSENHLRQGEKELQVDRDWRPVAFSSTGPIDEAPVVFCGYGIVAPQDDDQEGYDSFVHLDVKDKWVLALRYLPEDVTPERRQHLARYSSLRYKAMTARERGARGLILVTGPQTQVKQQLIPLQFDGSLGNSDLPVICVTNDVAAPWLTTEGLDLAKLQSELDAGEPVMGRELASVRLGGSIDIDKVRKVGHNVLGRLNTNPKAQDIPGTRGLVVLGAHVDHLGRGAGGNSLAREEEHSQIHFGADDNASGVSSILEITQALKAQVESGQLQGQRDLLVAAWSGEELGLLGSAHFVKELADQSHGTIYPAIAACVNLDMVGRFQKKLILQGIGSSGAWTGEIEQRNAPLGIPLTLQQDCYLPTDASSFYARGVPILSAFTGSHSEYHTPRDTPDRLDYESTARITQLMALITRSLLVRDDPPDFLPPQQAQQEQPRAFLRAYLGTIPDYAETDTPGVKLSGVAADGPASKAGVKSGDTIVELAGKKIANIYDYTYAIEALKVGQPVTITVQRDGESKTFDVVPGSRD